MKVWLFLSTGIYLSLHISINYLCSVGLLNIYWLLRVHVGNWHLAFRHFGILLCSKGMRICSPESASVDIMSKIVNTVGGIRLSFIFILHFSFLSLIARSMGPARIIAYIHTSLDISIICHTHTSVGTCEEIDNKCIWVLSSCIL